MKVMLGVALLAFATRAAAGPVLLDQVSFDQTVGALTLQDMNSRQAAGDSAGLMTAFAAGAPPMNMETILSVQRNLGISDPPPALANQVQAFREGSGGPGGQPIGACDKDNCGGGGGSTVPEPATMLTLGAGLLGASMLRRARKKAPQV